QGNWPSFLYPALAIAAAQAWMEVTWTGWTVWVWRIARPLATPVAAILLVAIYAQALFGVIPFGRSDPLARLLAVGFDAVGQNIEAVERKTGAAAIVTTDYESTAWFSFYLAGHPPVIQANEVFRYPDGAVPAPDALRKPLLYVVEQRLDKHALFSGMFSVVRPVARFDRLRSGVPIAHYVAYELSGWRGQSFGRVP
ncbi:MAG TPA: hypothetical protein VJ476_02450, partial [Rhizomicrobium sp.]|nr:hypothetical protein [Rhizomicrobium sp.]